jgi:carboxyl-terminal processing protease
MAIPTRGLVLGATAAAVTAVVVVGAGLHLPGSQALFRDSPKELVDEVWQLIDRTYVDGTFNQVDWKAVRSQYLERSYSNKEEAYGAVREMLKLLGDPYTRFMNPQEYKNMQVDTSGELFGVGIQLSADEKTKKLTVIAPIEDSPAFAAGIQSKDIITYIDGKSTDGMDVNAAVNLIRGPAGTKVKLTIQRGGKSQDYALTRARIEIHPVKFSSQPLPNFDKPAGYIRLTQFSAKAPDEMRNAMLKLEQQNVGGYVLDLRSNPGGLLDASVQIAKFWINEGKIVSTVERQGESSSQQANRSALTDKPVVVLVDGGSASASEILSGAMQDNKRAIIVGTKTFGKGLVQSVRELRDGSGLAVTIAKYLTPNGRDINKHGIDPDVAVQLSDDKRKELVGDRDKIGTLADPQYAKAVEILTQRIKGQSIPIASPSPSATPSPGSR